MNKIYRAYKYRIYPNNDQRKYFEQTFGNTRFIYNYFLDSKIKAKENKESISLFEAISKLNDLKEKEEYSWLKISELISLQESLKDLDKAFKSKEYPRFHKKGYKESFRTRNKAIQIEGNYINIPTIGLIKTKVSRLPKGRILNITISKTKTNKYFISLCVEKQLILKENKGGNIGIDLGIKDFATLSNGEKIANPKYLSKYEKKLKHLQRKLSKKIESHIIDYKVIDDNRYPIYDKPLRECMNINKQRIKVAKINEKINNCKNDFLHKLSTKLVKENQFISLEDLNISNMVKNNNLAKSINEASWSSFLTMLKYKSIEYNTTIKQINRFYPSSKICNNCGYINNSLTLKDRYWTCPKCNTYLDRDINASINILKEGLRLA